MLQATVGPLEDESREATDKFGDHRTFLCFVGRLPDTSGADHERDGAANARSNEYDGADAKGHGRDGEANGRDD